MNVKILRHCIVESVREMFADFQFIPHVFHEPEPEKIIFKMFRGHTLESTDPRFQFTVILIHDAKIECASPVFTGRDLFQLTPQSLRHA